jgi:hypothetical protein
VKRHWVPIGPDTLIETDVQDLTEDREEEIRFHHSRETRSGVKTPVLGGGGSQRRPIFYDE